MFSIALLSLVTPDAQACGGFFCNNIEPVEQSGEAVVFEVDGVQNQTTMHVQVEYTGPEAEFAWIVPVSGEPDLFLSNEALFTTLQRITEPRFNMSRESDGECPLIWMDEDGDGVSDTSESVSDGVIVLAEETVGPYDTVTLQAEDSAALISWLQANGYQVPSVLEPVLEPYIGDRRNFVALRLTSGAGVGDLAPLGLRYDGVRPAVPIQLTSVAAAPDMQLVTYVFGPERAVPTNYLHVELNETAIDWFRGGDNYREVLSRAADEAGGHAFATDFAGPTESLQGLLWNPAWDDLDLASAEGPVAFLEAIMDAGVPASAVLLEIFTEHIAVGEGLTPSSVYNCPSCWEAELDAWNPDFDAAMAASEIDSRVFEPLRMAEGMFARNSTLTRLSSTVSPEEMTLDPEFGFNATMAADVPAQRWARLVYQCDDTLPEGHAVSEYTAPKKLILPSGTEIAVPSSAWLQANGYASESEYLMSLQEPAAARIEMTAETGIPVVIFDGHGLIDQLVEDHNEATERLESTGCSSVSALSLGWMFLAVPLFWRRR